MAPAEAFVHNSLGVALMETGKVDEAIEHYRKALALNPKYVEAYDDLGEALAEKGNDEEAIRQFETAVRLNPKFTIAHANLGMVLVRTGRMDKAIFHLRKAVEENPDAADTRRNLGHALAEKGYSQEASVQLGEAVRLSDAKDPVALYLLGCVYADMGRNQDAQQLKRTALATALQQHNTELAQTISSHLSDQSTTRWMCNRR